jgi:hypothetical protein
MSLIITFFKGKTNLSTPLSVHIKDKTAQPQKYGSISGNCTIIIVTCSGVSPLRGTWD